MTADFAIPLLPCRSLDETIGFYEPLGFEVTHRQKAPNLYLALRRGSAHLHFFGLAALDPATAYSTCLLMVAEVEQLHGEFAEQLRSQLGRAPFTGMPRLTRMRPGQTRFTLVDPCGNSIIFIRHGEPNPHTEARPVELSPLGRSLRAAEILRDFKNDDAQAAKVLDGALAKFTEAPLAERTRALIVRLELAEVLGEEKRARALRMMLKGLAKRSN